MNKPHLSELELVELVARVHALIELTADLAGVSKTELIKEYLADHPGKRRSHPASSTGIVPTAPAVP